VTPPQPMSLAAAEAIADLRARLAAHEKGSERLHVELIRHIDDCIDHRKNDQRIRHDAADRVFGVVTEMRHDIDNRMSSLAAKVDANTMAIHARISSLRSDSSGRWEKYQNYLIGLLIAVCGFLLLRQLGWDSPAPAPQTIPFGSLPAAPPPVGGP
jgi:hypothetical protein